MTEAEGSIRPDVSQVIESMTPAQLAVAEMMLTAEVDGKLVRRLGTPGKFTYYTVEGRFPMVTIAQNPQREFVGAANLADPQNPDIPLLPYYVNLRGGTPENYEVMARAIAERRIPFDFDYVTGIPNTGNEIAKALAKILDVPYYEVLEKSGTGTSRQFKITRRRTLPGPRMEALLVDDLITKARTKIEAESELYDNEFDVAGHAVGYDREEGGLEEMEELGRFVVAGLNATQLFAVAIKEGKVGDEVYNAIMNRINSGKRAREAARVQTN